MARQEGLLPWNVRASYRNNNNPRNRNNNNGLRVANHSASCRGLADSGAYGWRCGLGRRMTGQSLAVWHGDTAKDKPPFALPVDLNRSNVGMGHVSEGQGYAT